MANAEPNDIPAFTDFSTRFVVVVLPFESVVVISVTSSAIVFSPIIFFSEL